MEEGVDFVQRNIFKDRLTEKEIVELGERAGGVASLVPRKQRDEVEGMSEEEITRYLAEDPSRIKRPIIDTGEHVYIGFSQTVQQQLEG
ncbi:MAG TPA: ArsC/Spx/MgsR family protein [Actinomycetota bacterium]|nr:ArsC/Spx/MgsR family protein [Actinomycetota bacterium]